MQNKNKVLQKQEEKPIFIPNYSKSNRQMYFQSSPYLINCLITKTTESFFVTTNKTELLHPIKEWTQVQTDSKRLSSSSSFPMNPFQLCTQQSRSSAPPGRPHTPAAAHHHLWILKDTANIQPRLRMWRSSPVLTTSYTTLNSKI